MKKIAIVTGASRGIGAATAKKLAENGYDICINYESNKAAASAVLNSVQALGRKAILVQADVALENDISRLFSTVDDELGPVSLLVNNAGILFKQATLMQMDAERIQKVLSVNVTGTFLCCKEAIRRMSLKNGGSGGVIVNVSSAAARLGAPSEYVDYAASKGAVDTLTIGLAKEVAEEGIRVNAVRPGLIFTDIHAAGGEPERVERLKGFVPMKRGGTAEEVAAAIAWLASAESSYVTGSFIDVAGGR